MLVVQYSNFIFVTSAHTRNKQPINNLAIDTMEMQRMEWNRVPGLHLPRLLWYVWESERLCDVIFEYNWNIERTRCMSVRFCSFTLRMCTEILDWEWNVVDFECHMPVSFVLLFQSFKTTPRWLRIPTVVRVCMHILMRQTQHTHLNTLRCHDQQNVKRTSPWGQQTSATMFLFCFTFYFAWRI